MSNTAAPSATVASSTTAPSPRRLPTFFLPHGGGPCFFMDWTRGPADTWDRLAAFLKGLIATLPEKPRAVVVVSGHWETGPRFTVNAAARPPLYFDYYGFPPHTYELQWPVPGDPALAGRIRGLLEGAGFATAADTERGLDHGVFVPGLLVLPDADVPVVELSLRGDLDPAAHLKAGAALAPLRDEGVLVVGTGMSFHNMRAYHTPAAGPASKAFDDWLTAAVETGDAGERARQLIRWEDGPSARFAHPREEHLLPLMVVAGAGGGDAGRKVFEDRVMGATVSAYRFG